MTISCAVRRQLMLSAQRQKRTLVCAPEADFPRGNPVVAIPRQRASEADPRPSFRLDLREIVLPLCLVVELSIHGRDEVRARKTPVL